MKLNEWVNYVIWLLLKRKDPYESYINLAIDNELRYASKDWPFVETSEFLNLKSKFQMFIKNLMTHEINKITMQRH